MRIKNALLLFLGILGESIKKRTTPILTYHSIDNTDSIISISLDDFCWQMGYLKKQGFKTIFLKDYINILKATGKFPERSAVITFDDGARNILDIAFPILKNHGFIATVFLVSGYVGKIAKWEMKEGLPRFPLMCWDDLRQLLDNGFDIQPHSKNHLFLTSLEPSHMEREISESRAMIETTLKTRANIFCYPYGDYNDITINVLKKLGFIGAMTTEFGMNNKHADVFRLKRIGSAHFSGYSAFKACLWGTYGPLFSVKSKFKLKQ